VGVDAGYEFFAHTADVGLRAWGASAAEVFGQAALALVRLLYDPATVAERERLDLSLEAPDGELLLVEWLNEVLYTVDAGRLLFRRFEVAAAGPVAEGPPDEVGVPWRLEATGVGEPPDARRHRVVPAVKAATLHGLALRRGGEGWVAEVVLDV